MNKLMNRFNLNNEQTKNSTAEIIYENLIIFVLYLKII